MRILQTIKEFLLFRDNLAFYQKIDITDEDKTKLNAFDKDILDKLYNQTLEKIANSMIKEDLSSDFYRWAKFSIYFFKAFFRDYEKANKYKTSNNNNTNNK